MLSVYSALWTDSLCKQFTFCLENVNVQDFAPSKANYRLFAGYHSLFQVQGRSCLYIYIYIYIYIANKYLSRSRREKGYEVLSVKFEVGSIKRELWIVDCGVSGGVTH